MHPHAREMVEVAQRLGFTLTGTDGRGHLALVHTNGETVHIPSTPSEYRGRKNTIAQLERVSGQRLPRANHRRSHKKVQGSGFDPSAAALECAAWHAKHDADTEELWERRARLVAECQDLAQDRGLLKHIPKRLAVIAQLEQQLVRLGETVTAFDPHTLAQ